jgi:hypothetical protein
MGIAKVQSLETRIVNGSMELSGTAFGFSQDRNTYHEREGKDDSRYREVLAYCACESKKSEFLPAEVILLTQERPMLTGFIGPLQILIECLLWYGLDVLERQVRGLTSLPMGPISTNDMAELNSGVP